jgi:hypothetical protein
MQKEDIVQSFLMIILILLLSVALIASMTMNTHNKILVQNASASSSPSFQRQELTLSSGSWFDMFSGKSTTRDGTNYIDIQSVSYFSNGTDLNATLWLAGFTTSPNDYELVDYGMYFDADSNNRTGLGGIDYKVEISWNNESRTWTRTFEEWSSSGKSKTLSKEEENVTDFSQDGASYVTLFADLDSMLSPNKYRVLFYAEGINRSLQQQFSWIIDSTNWISIPSPELVFVISPSPIVLIQGGEYIAEVRINSSSPEELELNINPYVAENSSNSKLITMKPDSERLLIPPFGVVSTHMRVSITPDIQPTDYMIIMRANITTVNTAPFAEPGSTQSETQKSATNNDQQIGISRGLQAISEFVSKTITDQPVFKSSVFSIQVKEWKFDEQLNSFVNQWITPLTAIYTTISSIVAGILGWIYGRRRSEDRNNNNNN